MAGSGEHVEFPTSGLLSPYFKNMTDILVPVIAAVGGITATAVSVLLTRTRLARLEAVSRILKDLPVHDPAFEPLSKVREEDAVELRSSQRSPWRYLIGISVAALVLGLTFAEFGDLVKDWSENFYILFVMGVLFGYFLVLVMYLAVVVAGSIRLVRWCRDFLRSARERFNERAQTSKH